MTDTPSNAAIDKADTLAAGCGTFRQAFALYIDEVDRVARELEDGAFRLARPVIQAKARSLMLPDPVDPLAEALLEAGYTIPPMRADEVRQALAKRGYKLVKERADG